MNFFRKKSEASENFRSRESAKGKFLGLCTILVIIYRVFSVALNAHADPPASPYAPGATLNPACSPTSTNCTVLPPLFSTTTLPLGAILFVNDASGTITAATSSLYWIASSSMFQIGALPSQGTTSSVILLGPNLLAPSSGNVAGTWFGINQSTSTATDFLNLETNSTTELKVSSSGLLTVQNITDSNITNALHLANGNGLITAYGGSSCSGGNLVASISATGTVICSTTSTILVGYSTSTGANPTASSGLSAINGTANTFMRSDAAPAISQGIIPIWTGLHTFSGGALFNSTGGATSTLQISGLPPRNATGSLILLGSNIIQGGNVSGTYIGANPTSSFNGDFINFRINSSTKFLVNSSGSLEIGTGTPVTGSMLTIASTSVILTVLTNGNVGIGTTSPQFSLDVHGPVHSGPEFTEGFNPWDTGASNTFSSFIVLNPPASIQSALLGMEETTSSTPNLVINGVHGQATAANSSGSIGPVVGVSGEADGWSTGTGSVVTMAGVAGTSEVHSGIDAPEVDGGYFQSLVDTGAGAVSMIGVHILSNVNNGGTLTDYGLKIDSQLGVGTTSYQLYSSTTLPFVISGAGNVSIGTSSALSNAILTIGTSSNIISILSNGNFLGNISNLIQTSSPVQQVATAVVGSNPFGIYVSGSYAYVANEIGNTLSIVDISNPYSPIQIATTSVGGNPYGVYVAGRYAYVTNQGSSTISVVDVSKPTAPIQVATTSVGGNPYNISVSGRYAYTTNQGSGTISVIDISNPYSPIQIATTSVGSNPIGLYVAGRYAYVSNFGSNTMSVVDISKPTAPTQVGTAVVGSNPYGMYVSGRYAYVPNDSSNTISVVDISKPAAPIQVATTTVGSNPYGIYVAGRYAYVANDSSNNISVVDISGEETSGLIANSADIGNLQVRNEVAVQGQLQVAGGLNLGGSFYQSNTSTPSAFAGALTIGGGNATTSKLIGPTSTLLVCARSNCTFGNSASSTNSVSWFASVDGTQSTQSIAARGYISGGLSDMGEFIPVAGGDAAYAQGDVVSIMPTSTLYFQKSGVPYDPKLAGVITTTAGIIAGGGEDSHGSTVIALAGRVPVTVTMKNGPIHIGDVLTSSDIPGVAMRATQPGRIIGFALQDDLGGLNAPNATSQVLMFVNPGWSLGSLTDTADIAASPWALTSGGQSALDQFTKYVQAALSKLGFVIVNGVATLKGVIAGTVTTDNLCVQGVCINGSQLKNILNNSGGGSPTIIPPPAPSAPAPSESIVSTGTMLDVFASSTPAAATTSDIQTTTVLSASSSGG